MSTRLERIGASMPRHALAAVALCASAWVYADAANTAKVNSATREQMSTETAAAQAQVQINKIDDQTRDLVAEYRATIQETESLKRYNAQLTAQIQSQEDEMVSIAQQLEQIETTAREVVPTMQRMLATIEQFVQLDLPFLTDERAKRISDLKATMGRADVSIAEKYRRIMEAYQVEMEYGRTLEAYQGTLVTEDGTKTVDFLRLGRVALMYQTLDRDETGYWDHNEKQWVEDNGYEDAVRDGLKVAKKQSAPALLIAPVNVSKESN